MSSRSTFERHTNITLLYSQMYYKQLMNSVIIYNNELNPCIKENDMINLFRCSPDLCCRYSNTKTFFLLRQLLREFDIDQCFDHYHTSDSVEHAFVDKFKKYNTKKIQMSLHLLYDCSDLIPEHREQAVLVTEKVNKKDMVMMTIIHKDNFNWLFGEVKHYMNFFAHEINNRPMQPIQEVFEEEIADTLPNTLSYNTLSSTVSEVAPSFKRSGQCLIEYDFLSRKRCKTMNKNNI